MITIGVEKEKAMAWRIAMEIVRRLREMRWKKVERLSPVRPYSNLTEYYEDIERAFNEEVEEWAL